MEREWIVLGRYLKSGMGGVRSEVRPHYEHQPHCKLGN